MQTLYPTLYIGLEAFGRSALTRLGGLVLGHKPCHSPGVGYLGIGVYPKSKEGADEPETEKDRLPSFHYFSSKAEFDSMRLPMDPDATLPLEARGLLDRAEELTKSLQAAVDGLLHVDTAGRLGTGLRFRALPNYIVHIVVIASLADDEAWALLDENVWALFSSIPDAVSRLSFGDTGQALLSLVVYVDDKDVGRRDAMQRRLKHLESRLSDWKGRMRYAECFPFANRLQLGTIADESQVCAAVSYFAFLLALPFTGDPEPLVESLSVSRAHGEDRRPLVADGIAVDHVPTKEVLRRIAYSLGAELFARSVCATTRENLTETDERLQAQPLFIELAENHLFGCFLEGLPVNPEWREDNLPKLTIDKHQLEQRIGEAPIEMWVELVDNFDYVIQIARMDRWLARVDENGREQVKAFCTGTEGILSRAIDEVLRQYRQPILVARRLLEMVEVEITNDPLGKRKTKRITVPEGAPDIAAKRTLLETEVASFPSTKSTRLRGGLLAACAATLPLAIMGTDWPGLGLSAFLVLSAIGGTFLMWSLRHNRLLSRLNELIRAVETKYTLNLQKAIQDQLIGFDNAVEILIKSERESLDQLVTDCEDVQKTYGVRATEFDPDDSHFLHSVVTKKEIPVLYREGGYSNDAPSLIDSIILASGLLVGWRLATEDSLRRHLWPELMSTVTKRQPDISFTRFIEVGEVPTRLHELTDRAEIALRHRDVGSVEGRVFMPSGDDWANGVSSEASRFDLNYCYGTLDEALAVIRTRLSVVPSLYADDHDEGAKR